MTEQLDQYQEAAWEAERDEALLESAPVKLMRALEAVRHIVALTSSRINVKSAHADGEINHLYLTIVGRRHAREIAEHFAGDKPIRDADPDLYFGWRYLGTEYFVWIRVELTDAEKIAVKRAELAELEGEVAS